MGGFSAASFPGDKYKLVVNNIVQYFLFLFEYWQVSNYWLKPFVVNIHFITYFVYVPVARSFLSWPRSLSHLTLLIWSRPRPSSPSLLSYAMLCFQRIKHIIFPGFFNLYAHLFPPLTHALILIIFLELSSVYSIELIFLKWYG